MSEIKFVWGKVLIKEQCREEKGGRNGKLKKANGESKC